MVKKYKSEILMVLHQEAIANFEVGAITEEEMREYDKDCLVHEPEQAEEAPADC
jgi:DNA-binding transcriptional regulator YiaG